MSFLLGLPIFRGELLNFRGVLLVLLDLDSLEGFEIGCCWCIFWKSLKSLNCGQAPKAHLAAARALIQCPQQVLEKQEVSGEGELGWLGPFKKFGRCRF